MRSFYDLPAVYDAIHLPDSQAEAEGAWAVIERFQPHARDLLEPACGTGRYLAYFADKGLSTTGYDINARPLSFARRRLRGKAASVVKASMTDYVRPKSFDAAFSLIGTFRHLLTEKDALRHLELTARSLRPGGVYVLGLDLVDYDDNLPDEEGFEVLKNGRKLQHLYMTLPPDRKKRRERIINFVTVDHRVLQDEYDLRSYDAKQWRGLIAASPFRLAGTYTAEGKLSRLTKQTRYALFALKKT